MNTDTDASDSDNSPTSDGGAIHIMRAVIGGTLGCFDSLPRLVAEIVNIFGLITFIANHPVKLCAVRHPLRVAHSKGDFAVLRYRANFIRSTVLQIIVVLGHRTDLDFR